MSNDKKVKVISVFNNKGGVGKTTLLWNIADALARQNFRVLMIDFDPQCNLSLAVLGQNEFRAVLHRDNAPYGVTIRAYLQRFLQNTDGEEFFSHKGKYTNTNAELLAGDFWLNAYSESLNVGADLLSGTGISRYAVLRNIIQAGQEKTQAEYDYVLIDLPPSFGAIVRAALYTSDYFIIPCTADTFSAYCVGLIGQMLPKFFDDWQAGFKRFKQDNSNITDYDSLGAPRFAGWIFNGFDTRGGGTVKADAIHQDNMSDAIRDSIVQNDRIASVANLPTNGLIGEIEDMNVLIQNSIWQSIPISQLGNHAPLKTLQDKGSWAPNQRQQIVLLTKAFDAIATNIAQYCK